MLLEALLVVCSCILIRVLLPAHKAYEVLDNPRNLVRSYELLP